MDNQRLIFFIIFSFSIILLWDAWQKDQNPNKDKVQDRSTVSSAASLSTPKPSANLTATPSPINAIPVGVQAGKIIKVRTDVFYAEIDSAGGDIRHLELLKHGDSDDKNKPLVLYKADPKGFYVAQSGLIGNGLPNHKSIFTADAVDYSLLENSDQLQVKLAWQNPNGLSVVKSYFFHKSSYLIDISFDISNNGTTPLDVHSYYQFLRNGNAAQGDPKFVNTYTGPAVYTDKEKFQKVEFSDIDKNKEKYPKQSNDGWIAMLQHYYFSAWLPMTNTPREFFTKKIGENYAAGVIIPIGDIPPGSKQSSKMALYAGPQDQGNISKLAPGLDLVVDYGMLTVIAAPLFWIVAMIYKVVQNWGIAIILLTVLIKLAFYPLSAKSYRSMAAMRILSPKLQKLKEQYGDDRERLHHAMMELYKTEKINPLGGCLPVVVQMPVFIALYWVLLYSVEMRQAPFMAWVQDLSSPDPYYVLPILMGITMIIQTKLNPTPPDPIQAKVMMLMPIFFSIFFFFFPAGLVLYWLVNNILSIAQQWQITRGIERAAKGHG
ncbi:MAG: membrane protein insertase YidC [Bacteroidales bacterium]|nr:membrane protein insertase YidC [Bacteroidales bacterium]